MSEVLGREPKTRSVGSYFKSFIDVMPIEMNGSEIVDSSQQQVSQTLDLGESDLDDFADFEVCFSDRNDFANLIRLLNNLSQGDLQPDTNGELSDKSIELLSDLKKLLEERADLKMSPFLASFLVEVRWLLNGRLASFIESSPFVIIDEVIGSLENDFEIEGGDFVWTEEEEKKLLMARKALNEIALEDIFEEHNKIAIEHVLRLYVVKYRSGNSFSPSEISDFLSAVEYYKQIKLYNASVQEQLEVEKSELCAVVEKSLKSFVVTTKNLIFAFYGDLNSLNRMQAYIKLLSILACLRPLARQFNDDLKRVGGEKYAENLPVISEKFNKVFQCKSSISDSPLDQLQEELCSYFLKMNGFYREIKQDLSESEAAELKPLMNDFTTFVNEIAEISNNLVIRRGESTGISAPVSDGVAEEVVSAPVVGEGFDQPDEAQTESGESLDSSYDPLFVERFRDHGVWALPENVTNFMKGVDESVMGILISLRKLREEMDCTDVSLWKTTVTTLRQQIIDARDLFDNFADFMSEAVYPLGIDYMKDVEPKHFFDVLLDKIKCIEAVINDEAELSEQFFLSGEGLIDNVDEIIISFSDVVLGTKDTSGLVAYIEHVKKALKSELLVPSLATKCREGVDESLISDRIGKAFEKNKALISELRQSVKDALKVVSKGSAEVDILRKSFAGLVKVADVALLVAISVFAGGRINKNLIQNPEISLNDVDQIGRSVGRKAVELSAELREYKRMAELSLGKVLAKSLRLRRNLMPTFVRVGESPVRVSGFRKKMEKSDDKTPTNDKVVVKKVLEGGVESIPNKPELITERPVEKKGEIVSDAGTEMIGERVLDAGTEMTGERVLDAGTEITSERVLDAGAEITPEKTVETSLEQSPEKAAEKSPENNTEVKPEKMSYSSNQSIALLQKMLYKYGVDFRFIVKKYAKDIDLTMAYRLILGENPEGNIGEAEIQRLNKSITIIIKKAGSEKSKIEAYIRKQVSI